MGRLARSWRLMGATLRMLRRDKKLLIFPVISAVAIVMLAALFVTGGIAYVATRGGVKAEEWEARQKAIDSAQAALGRQEELLERKRKELAEAPPERAGALRAEVDRLDMELAELRGRISEMSASQEARAREANRRLVLGVAPFVILAYFVGSFIVIFFNSALVGCVLLRLEGRTCGIRDGLRLAWERRGAIATWAVFYALVGGILDVIDLQARRLPFVGSLLARISTRIVGLAWSLVTFMIVPVIVFEEQTGLWSRVRRSGALFRRTWGEQIAGRVTIGAAMMIIAIIVTCALTGGVVFAGMSESLGDFARGVLLGSSIGLILLFLVAMVLVSSALNGIYSAVLYTYAATGMLPQEFPEDLLPAASGEGEIARAV